MNYCMTKLNTSNTFIVNYKLINKFIGRTILFKEVVK